MKTILTYLATLLFVVTQYSLGQEIKGNQIIVYGNAEVKATANQAELNFRKTKSRGDNQAIG